MSDKREVETQEEPDERRRTESKASDARAANSAKGGEKSPEAMKLLAEKEFEIAEAEKKMAIAEKKIIEAELRGEKSGERGHNEDRDKDGKRRDEQ